MKKTPVNGNHTLLKHLFRGMYSPTSSTHLTSSFLVKNTVWNLCSKVYIILDMLPYLSWLQAACRRRDADMCILRWREGKQPRCYTSRSALGCRGSWLIGLVCADFMVCQVKQCGGVVTDRRGPKLDQRVGELQRRAGAHGPARQIEISENEGKEYKLTSSHDMQ